MLDQLEKRIFGQGNEEIGKTYQQYKSSITQIDGRENNKIYNKKTNTVGNKISQKRSSEIRKDDVQQFECLNETHEECPHFKVLFPQKLVAFKQKVIQSIS